MRTPLPLAADRRGRASAGLVGLAVGLALTGCGGGAASGTGEPSRSPSTATADTRPEGPWTMVAWTVSRSDISVEQRMARTILATFTPACPSGPCDLTMAPAGRDGTYREPETPLAAGSTPTTATVDLTWDGAAYAGASGERTTSCTAKGGVVVPDGYRMATAFSLAFVPAAGATPARLHGTIEHTAKGTPAGLTKGCTDFVETEAVGGVRTGSLDPKTAPTGAYGASLTTAITTPKSVAATGSLLWLGTMSASGTGATGTITGLTGSPGPLSLTAGGWSATTPVAPSVCRAVSGATVASGADAQETFEDLHAVALTPDGEPIFTGRWKDRLNPNAAGLKGGCSLTAYEGRLLLVPEGAGQP